MSVIGMGVDLVECARIERSLERFGEKFLRRVFTQGEIEYSMSMKFPARHLAARFGAVRSQGSGIESVRYRHRQSDGLAQHRHPQKEKRRTVSGFFRSCAGACWETRCNVSARHPQSHGAACDGVCRFGKLTRAVSAPLLSPAEAVLAQSAVCRSLEIAA